MAEDTRDAGVPFMTRQGRCVMGQPVQVRIGTSGWHYDHWRGPYYPPQLPSSDLLEYYAREFDSVEINNSFYRLPARATFEAWKRQSPPGFCFAVKASRYLTHWKKLQEPAEAVERLLEAAGGLGRKLGPILFQLPPRWHCNVERLRQFLAVLPRGRRYSIECRDPSWHTSEVYGLLERHRVSFCIFELGGLRSPAPVTADHVYLRLHGPGEKYQGSYAPAALAAWAGRIRQWSKAGLAVYCYFDNDQAAYAVQNARALKAAVARRRLR
ncbi:MAG: hypothetical protein UZ03_NOB001000781 [Nitrospira sp. OLB3]|nr:MAG: hypothetical protein UZ03_NOB001000781 [Nitrospira sp. OLB3]